MKLDRVAVSRAEPQASHVDDAPHSHVDESVSSLEDEFRTDTAPPLIADERNRADGLRQPIEQRAARLRAAVGRARRNRRVSVAELTRRQRAFLSRPRSGGQRSTGSLAQNVRQTVQTQSRGGEESDWGDVSIMDGLRWRLRAGQVITQLRDSDNPEIRTLTRRYTILFAPQSTDERDAYAYRRFVLGSPVLYVSRDWVADAEKDLESVYANIVHEFGGHVDFREEDSLSYKIMKPIIDGMSRAERGALSAGGKSWTSAYVYPEIEIYAELREWPHRTESSGGDSPERDIPRLLRRIRDQFAPDVGPVIAHNLSLRVKRDPKVTPDARRALDRMIDSVFD